MIHVTPPNAAGPGYFDEAIAIFRTAGWTCTRVFAQQQDVLEGAAYAFVFDCKDSGQIPMVFRARRGR